MGCRSGFDACSAVEFFPSFHTTFLSQVAGVIFFLALSFFLVDAIGCIATVRSYFQFFVL